MFVSKRPPVKERQFISNAVESLIAKTSRLMADDELAWLFENCYPNTLDTTVTVGERNGVPDTFVITGDIEAMWLRDSSAQVWPYLALAENDADIRRLIEGVIRRQAACILLDPYANAFNAGPTLGVWASDETAMKPGLHERKFEIDSLCYPIRLSYGYWKTTGEDSLFDTSWHEAMRHVVKTFREQQRLKSDGPYYFRRRTTVPYDTLPLNGYGNPTRKVGLIHSMFRPSDDACLYPFLIPSNLFAMVSLQHLAEICDHAVHEKELASECRSLASELKSAITTYGIVRHPRRGLVYAYEVDGFGNVVYMDDANVPSLLSLPYLGCVAADDPVYQNTRALVLGNDNPYFFSGTAGEGIGGPHVGLGQIWPLGIIMRALTSSDGNEIRHCLTMLKKTHAGTGFMHESFDKDDASKFTRSWFAWANTLFGELILRVSEKYPGILGEVL